MPTHGDRDRGQAAIMFVVVAVAIAAATASALAHFGVRVRERTRAQSAADAVALASLDGGRQAAVRLAAANGAIVLSWESGPGVHEVTVVVQHEEETATARATDQP